MSNIQPSSNITNIFANWLGYPKRIKTSSELMCALYSELYEIFVMILSLTGKVSHHSCRLSLWLRTESICGYFSSRRSSTRLWIFGAAGLQQKDNRCR
jgi:hypothetical protein